MLTLFNQMIVIMKKLLLLFLFLSFVIIAKAQPPARILFNSSFEEPVICGDVTDPNNTNTCYSQIPQADVVGWNVETENLVEVWRNNFGSVRAQDGRQHVELNAQNPSNVYLSVCLLNAETVTLTFAHRARRGNGANPANSRIDIMEVATFNETNLADNTIVTINNATITATNVNDAIGGTWTGSGTVNTLGTNSFRANSPTFGWTQYSCSITNNGASGPCRIRFRGIGGGSLGNFIDNVVIGGLNPLTEFESANYSDIEGTGGNQPRLLINGRVDIASTVDILVQNGTATNPSDYTTVGTITVNIPAGDYNGTWAQGISFPLGIINDNDFEPNETIFLSYVLGSETGNIRIADADCNITEILNTTYTIIDDDILLPVTFTEWKLDDTECGIVKLHWTTSQELNSDYFEVQFSDKGKEWKSIGKLTAKGTAHYTNDYSFIHKTDYKSGYYRLNQVDFDGKSSITHVISSKQDCDKAKNSFKFYPNPKSSNQSMNIEFYSTYTSLDYTIVDALGREVRNNSISTTSNQFVKQEIQENLSKGLYLVKFWQNGKKVYETKLIVE